MLGTKRTIPFWRAKRRLLTLERALAPERRESGKGAMTAPALPALAPVIGLPPKRGRRAASQSIDLQRMPEVANAETSWRCATR